MAYCTQAQIERQAHAALTDAQVADVAAWQALAESLIDAAAPGHWATAPILSERHDMTGPYVWLRSAPLVSVEALRLAWRGETTTQTLTLTSEYEIDDPTTGRLYIPTWDTLAYHVIAPGYQHWTYLLADYTPVGPPACVQEATAALLAEWLTHGPGVAAGTLQSVKLGAFSVQRGSGATQPNPTDLPPRVLALLAPVRRMIFA